MRVFELFSGIGGMHFAFKESSIDVDIVRALDINTTANSVYRHNFPETKLMENNIQSLTADLFNQLEIEIISMSPPCQPFTRQGLQKGSDDNRSTALKHILALLPSMKTLKYIILENVVGFEVSSTRDDVINVLETAQFRYQEFILSPSQFGVPNSRNRYYLLAKKNHLGFIFKEHEKIHSELPVFTDDTVLSVANKFRVEMRCVESFLDATPGSILPDKVLQKYAFILDIVTRESTRTCCFTKGYTHYTEGTGSVFCPFTTEHIKKVYESIKDVEKDDLKYLERLKTLEMRYFSPMEVARLMSFPNYFNFPDNLSEKQKYRLLGNSVNVHVVAVLIKLLVS